jgi:acyl-coenzyme A synthetase/AMP-(fatty) acid ligase
LTAIADGVSALAAKPALLLWGPSDPVFSDLYLRDLETRFPDADVHRFVGAGHLLPEDADVATPIFEWVSRLGASTTSAQPEEAIRPTLWAAIERLNGEADLAVVEMDGERQARSITFTDLATDVARVAAGLAASGVSKGDRVALLVPPGIDLSVCIYACWRLGAVVVMADAGLGPSGMSKALKSAAPAYLIGVTKAMAAARALRWPGKRISVEPLSAPRSRALGVWTDLEQVRSRGDHAAAPQAPDSGDVAAVVFTSGATGPAKGVTYRHHQAQAQRDAVMQVYGIREDDRFVAAFAPFALYGPAMGIPSVVPDMDVTAPGTLTASGLASAAAAVDATLVFASPAALANVVATADELTPSMRQALAAVRLLMSAGAPVSASLLERVAALVPNAELHTPYGMTEVLPVADISLEGIKAAGRGNGVCVGLPVDGVEVAINPLDREASPGGMLTRDAEIVGEVCIRAPHAKEEYDKLWVTQNASAEPDGWHRSGDVGHLDGDGRLWIEGRMIHIIESPNGPVTPVGIEHAAESVPGIAHTAAVGVGPIGTQQVVVVVALVDPVRSPTLADDALADEVRRAVPTDVAAVLTVPSLPVDKRHNSKIDRTRIAAWATAVLAGGRLRRL